MAMNTGMIQLDQPGWLWLIPFLIIVVLIWRRLGQYDENTGISSATSCSGLQFLHPLIAILPHNRLIKKPPVVRSMLYGIVFVCLVVCMAQPVRIGQQLPDPPQQRDIVFIVDTSVSMVLRDYVLDGKRLSRMNLLKGLLSRFIQELHGDRVSIIVFADNAYTLVPLTSDAGLVQRMLQRIEIGMAGRSSAIGDGIALAIKQAKQASDHRRVLVLMTDADQPSGYISPETAARIAAKEKLPLYTIAIGAGSYEAEEKLTSGLIYHPADLALLKSLARSTGAKSYQASDARTLQQAIADIEQREKVPALTTPGFYREPLYLWPLLPGLLILSLVQFGRLLSTGRQVT
jgi:Ca-activated chloride channel family protein